MFSSALKSFSSNINSGYSISPNPSSTSGPWRIFDAKKKSTGKEASVFVLDRKALESHTNSLARSSASSIRRATDEVVERLKKEASSLARLRHPNILELVEPVEETRNGGLQFATEMVSTSLAGLLLEKDEQERGGGGSGRGSRYVTQDSDGGRQNRELEIDELEIQKGLLQLGKALEFLHENAGLVHSNLTPEAIFINAKADWKISGFSFLSPPGNSTTSTSVAPVNLSEVLNIDSRLPRSVQIDLDWSSPDFVLDNNLNVLADMFSLGLLIIALYNSPHQSPIQANSSISAYKRIFSSSSTIPTASNSFLCSRPIPKDLVNSVLPRLITRRPTQRMTAKEFQSSPYFDNILISTIRFLDALPAKTPDEKAQFMRGLSKVLPSFPKSVLDKKVLPALLEEMKDREMISAILHNIFKIVEILPSARRPLSEQVLPRLKQILVAQNHSKGPPERDSAKEAGILVVLEHVQVLSSNCSGKDFKDNILPILLAAIESPTHSLVDKALRSLPMVLPVVDFLTIKNELFPVVANVFSKTSSLGIKVRGLEAFVVLCGGNSDPSLSNDGLNGIGQASKMSSASALDKNTMQERVIPLIRVIKTKEPSVALAALNVLRHVGGVADSDFVALHILPILWTMSLGPLLNLQQFQSFMDVIRTLSSRIESEQVRKLQDLGTDNSKEANQDFLSFGATSNLASPTNGNADSEMDFERLVKGTSRDPAAANPMDAWNDGPSGATLSPSTNSNQGKSMAASFSWSTPSNATSMYPSATPSQVQPTPVSRTITPDLSRYEALTPTSTQFSQALQPQTTYSQPMRAPIQSQPAQFHSSGLNAPPQSINWTAASNNTWGNSGMPPSNQPMASMNTSMSSMSLQQVQPSNAFAITQPPPGFSLPPPPSSNNFSMQSPATRGNAQPQKTGLDAYESLL